jgi:hypothetical protein
MDNELVIAHTWPATSMEGEPSIQSGSMLITRDPDGSALLTGMIGAVGVRAEDCVHFQFPLDPHHVQALLAFLST